MLAENESDGLMLSCPTCPLAPVERIADGVPMMSAVVLAAPKNPSPETASAVDEAKVAVKSPPETVEDAAMNPPPSVARPVAAIVLLNCEGPA